MANPKRTLRVLIIEDSGDDTALLVRAIQRADFEPQYERVDTPEETRRALIEQTWDLVISDYVLPQFSGLDALEIVQQSGADLPFIIVSGKIGEEVAVEALKAGANDYLLKDRLTRLGPAINRAMEEAEQRRKRRQSERALRESEERYRRLVESSPETTFIYTDGRFVYINPAGVQLFGATSPLDLIGKPVLDFIQEDCRPFAAEYLKQTSAGHELPLLQFKVAPLRGNPIYVEAIARSISYHGHDAAHMICRDITLRKEMEEQLQHAQRMEAIGRLAGGVAHDFNNLLTVMTGYAGLVKSSLRPDDPAVHDLEQINTSADRAFTLTHQLLTMSRKQVITTVEVDLNVLLTQARTKLQRILGDDIYLTQNPALDLGLIRADQSQVETVLLNVAAKARSSMTGGGTLTVETRNVTLTDSSVPPGGELKPGEYVMLQISDTGQGFPQELQGRIFEPFYPTQETGVPSNGLGMATVYGIVRQHGGYISFVTQLGKGSTFKVYFPRLSTPVARALPARPLAQPEQKLSTVLIVEDEDVLRDFARLILRKAGMQVLTANDGAEGVKAAENHGKPLDLVFTDLVMPNMNGADMAREIRRLHPETPVLFTSGYARTVLLEHGVADNDLDFLPKPYTAQTLMQRVRKALEKQTQPQ